MSAPNRRAVRKVSAAAARNAPLPQLGSITLAGEIPSPRRSAVAATANASGVWKSPKATVCLPPSIGSIVPLFGPGIAAHVIAARFPIAGLVLFHERHVAEPLRALPEIEMRHHEPHRAAVLAG